MADDRHSTSERAEAFVVRALTDVELYRRKHRREIGLPGEVHEVHTTFQELAEFCCKHCKKWNRLESPMRYNEGPHNRQCVFCGDHTVVCFYST